jgi:hypothetical protein
MIDSLLHRHHSAGPCLLLRGIPGIGKTALLDAAGVQAAANGTQVLRASGLELEAEIRFAALHQMLYPVRKHVDRLAGHHRDALAQIFDLTPGPAPVPLPLIRSAIVNLTPADERRAAHRALARTLAGDPVRRAWHLAEAACGPDEAVAQALDEAALSAWRRGEPSVVHERAPGEGPVPDRRVGASAAVTMLVRAGELSPHPDDRSRRLVEAAYLATCIACTPSSVSPRGPPSASPWRRSPPLRHCRPAESPKLTAAARHSRDRSARRPAG